MGQLLLVAVLSAAPLAPLRHLDPAERYAVPIADYPMRGQGTLVTLVELVDFSSDFSRRARPEVDRVEQAYRHELRLVLIPNAGASAEAQLGAEAFFAAHEQGKAFEFREAISTLEGPLTRAAVEAAAAKLGLRLAQVRHRLDTHFFSDRVSEARSMAVRLGAVGTPTVFANGKPLFRAITAQSVSDLVERELPFAAIAQQVAGSPLLASEALLDGAKKEGEPEPIADSEARPAALELQPELVAVPLDDSPVLGPREAPVAIVMFLDFECPFSKSTYRRVSELVREGAGVKLVVKHLPLTFHKHAQRAAMAAIAAAGQGRFYEMADALFAEEKPLQDDRLLAIAKKVGLELTRFQKDFAAAAGVIERDLDLARRSGVSSTPVAFVNGKPIRGAQPRSIFEGEVAVAAGRARVLAASGVPPAAVYDATMKALTVEARPPTPEFLGLVQALTACRDGRLVDAAEAYWGLDLFRRRLVVQECRALGLRLSP